MTRSQQELRFESGTAEESLNSDELAEQGLETLNSSPSRVLNRQSLLIRQSKGNPIYSKPVGIPIVPSLPKAELSQDFNSKMQQESLKPPQISPHKINNFVYEEDNRIVLDFGNYENNSNFPTINRDGHNSPSSESSRSSSGLLAKMKVTKANLKKSLSNVSNAGGTLRRKKSQKQLEQQQQQTNYYSANSTGSPGSTLSSVGSSGGKNNYIVKPSSAPPPPPPHISKPSSAPPPPPPRQQMSQSLYIPSSSGTLPTETMGTGTGTNATKVSKDTDDIVKPLEEFKIDLDTQSVSIFQAKLKINN
jgi:hypothetical protein